MNQKMEKIPIRVHQIINREAKNVLYYKIYEEKFSKNITFLSINRNMVVCAVKILIMHNEFV
jgi:hypothetical protein